MKANKLALSALAGSLICTAAIAVTPAYAEPSDHAYRTLAGVGSDTTQSVVNALSEAITSGGSKVIASYDAIDPTTGTTGGTIKTRSTGLSFTRPDGSSAGIKALTSSIKGLTYPATNGVDVTGQLDFARSSSGPSASGSDLTYIPFAKDAVSYAYSNTTSAKAVPADLTKAQLADIFSGTTTTYTAADSTTQSYVPILPQSGSGTRKYFLSALGLTESNVAWITTTAQENKGTTIDAIGEIAPFSVGSYIAQSNAVVTNTITATNVKIGSVEATSPTNVDGTLNTSFPLTRNVYNVVATARLSGTSANDLLLQSTFVGASSAVCSNTTIITTYGFGTLGASCGATTTTGAFVVDGSAPSIAVSVAPVISGSAKYGQVLTSSTGTWSGTATTPSYSYQWLRAAAPIAGATASTYTVTAADAGTALSVAVTATANTAKGTSTSAAVSVAKLSSSVKVSFNATAKKKNKAGKATIKVSVTGLSAPTGVVRIYIGTKKIGSGTLTAAKKGTLTIKMSKLKKGTKKIKVTFLGTSAVNSSTKTVTLKVK
jgi:VCBS repeat-containing protein